MYTAFYGLREMPFSLSPDPRFLYLAESHREALAHLLYGVEQGEGFIAVTGEVGTGKTTLCRTLLQRLGSGTDVAFLFNPDLSPDDLLRAVCAEYGLEGRGPSRRELIEEINQFLLQEKRDGRRVLLIIDEAQNLSPETLEQIRMLSNLETETSKLIQIILIGQPELDALLATPSLRQLRQRISVRWRLEPLSSSGAHQYVRHRLRIAGGAEREIFREGALREIYRRSTGIPRVINVLCDRALLAGYAAGVKEIDGRLVAEAAREIQTQVIPKPRESWLRRALPAATATLALLTLAAVGGLGWQLYGVRGGATGEDVSASPPGLGSDVQEPLAASVAAPQVATRTPIEEFAPEDRDSAFRLDSFLARIADSDATAAATQAVLVSWDLPPTEDPVDTFPDALAEIGEWGLAAFPIEAADLSMLQALNHPVWLELQRLDGSSRLVTLQALDAASATLWVEGNLRISRAELANRWNGNGFVIWREFEALPHILRPGHVGAGVAWLQQSLTQLGYYAGRSSGLYDAATAEAVRAFQRSHQLDVDGHVGPRTKMAIYAEVERYSVPRLVRPRAFS